MRLPSRACSARAGREGFALVLVLLVLLALLVLATPFLSMARDADRASAALADEAELALALDGAGRHARHVLADSHAGVDPTPRSDDADELSVEPRFPEGFLDPRDARGTMWDVAAEDLAGRIDLDSASPFVVANVLGGVARLSADAEEGDEKLAVGGAGALAPAGFAWIEGELVAWSSLEEAELGGVRRGLLAREEDRGGPRPARAHPAGAAVLDERALALSTWRIRGARQGRLRALDAPEELVELRTQTMAAGAGLEEEAGLGAEAIERLARLGTVFGDARGGHRWQRSARLVQRVEPGVDGQLVVDDSRWLGPGATVRVVDADEVELAVVTARDGARVLLDRVLEGDYRAFEAEVEVLVRRPVNVNTAGPEVLEALFANLQLAGTTNRITPGEARQLVALVVESRPLDGFEDFVRRIVLPSAGLEALPPDAPRTPAVLADGRGFLSREDALALWLNAYDPNDADLAVSTMPLGFVSSDVHALSSSASVNSPDGALRALALRDEVCLVAPQRELLSLWTRQEELDEALRLPRSAPYWRTGPGATFRWDQGSVPPRPVEAHLGPLEVLRELPGLGSAQQSERAATFERVFASRELEESWAQLWPARVAELGTLAGRVLHFDQETRHPEGRPLVEEPLVLSSDDAAQGFSVGWTASNDPLLRPLTFEAWVLPRALGDGLVLDVAGTAADSDRVTLGLEGGELVLRVLDAGGDHPASAFREAGELRYPLAQGARSPGLPLETWSHLLVDVRGNRPDQMTLLVNGLVHGVRALGSTRLTSGLSADAGSLTVESTEGFPPLCAVRIGFEVLEVEVTGSTTMRATHQATGAAAGFGGRSARVRFSGAVEPDVPLAPTNEAYPAGTQVELYGYSAPLVGGGAPAGEAVLASGLGPFRVARCIGGENASTAEGDPITWGAGFSALGVQGGTSSSVTGLHLVDADAPGTPDLSFAEAFDRRGGYAAIVQFELGATATSGVPIGGVEIVRYRTWRVASGPGGAQTVVLELAARGHVVASALPNYAQSAGHAGGTRAFVTQWNGITSGGVDLNAILRAGVYVAPISLSVPNQSPGLDFLPAEAGRSEFAQITEAQQPELTEWVRYDWFDASAAQLVRDAPDALDSLYLELISSYPLDNPPSQPGGGGPSGTGGGGGGGGGAAALHLASPAPASPAPRPAQGAGPALWVAQRGALEAGYASAWPLSRAALDAFQFRGVLGTHSHAHAPGTRVHPVFSVRDLGLDGGLPGAYDRAFVIDESPTHVGWPVTVHRAVLPPPAFLVHHWSSTTSVPTAGAPEVRTPTSPGYDDTAVRVALQDRLPEPIAASDLVARPDPRTRGRLCAFPSGERPRAVTAVAVGGGARSQGAVPDLVADELVFANPRFSSRGNPSSATAGAQLVLVEDLAAGAPSARFAPGAVRIPGELASAPAALGDLPEDAGLLRIGDELVAYDSRDPSSGTVTLAAGGRGLLGTREVPHQAGESVVFLERFAASVLGAQAGPNDARLSLAALDDFPTEGTVLVGEELVHYAGVVGGSLWMPSRSSEPGARDGRGEGLFRGRFGTRPAAHGAGEVVLLFPFRYWDRWAERADAPELAWLGLEVEQPAAFWRSFFYDGLESAGGVRLGCLVRSDPAVPWDADPTRTQGLRVTRVGTERGEPLALGGQSDRLELRFFVEYPLGAFDLVTGNAHGWRQTPRLVRAGAFYLAPSLTLWTLDR